MDFARKQLEKYGWTDGKGLGKNENGISEALKPKLKRSAAGIGHDAAKDFTEHWWNTLYDKAVKNVEVEEKNGKTKKIKTKDNKFKITNSSYHLNKKDDAEENGDYSDFFVKKAVLTSGGSKTERVRESESEDDEEEKKKDVFKMTDEELFAACEGRTAHKGARHGLRALGKLARIERQEQMLLIQPQFEGYSHAKKLKKNKCELSEAVVENTNLTSEGDEIQNVKKKKKKRKHCISNENEIVLNEPEIKDEQMAENHGDSVTNKKKKSKRKNDAVLNQESSMTEDSNEKLGEIIEAMETENTEIQESEYHIDKVKKNKKKKKKEKDL